MVYSSCTGIVFLIFSAMLIIMVQTQETPAKLLKQLEPEIQHCRSRSALSSIRDLAPASCIRDISGKFIKQAKRFPSGQAELRYLVTADAYTTG